MAESRGRDVMINRGAAGPQLQLYVSLFEGGPSILDSEIFTKLQTLNRFD